MRSSLLPARALLIALLATSLAVAACAYWVARGKPQAVPEGASDRVQCISYAPYRKPGESPFLEETVVSEARLREDLTLLSARTGCVRTYAVQQGLEAVPRVAQSLGMKVMLGAWLGRDRAKNEQEIGKVIALANRYPETVSAVVVGNEVLLRRELPEAVLAEYLQRVRRETTVPVTYADVWEFWIQHRQLAEQVSFVTIHILPYWEDHPVGIDAAIGHIVTIAQEMRKAFDGKDVLIGETGWPSAGRSRRAAVPSRVNQARFFRQFTQAAAEHDLRYNFIEAFDQPWKRRLEGAMGGQWGLFDSAGEAKFPATGPVAEDPQAHRGLLAAAAGMLLFAGITAAWRVRGWHLVTAGAMGVVSGAIMAAQWQYMIVWNRYWTEWAATGAYAVAAVAFVLVALHAVRDRLLPGLQTAPIAVAPSQAPTAAGAVPPARAVLARRRSGPRLQGPLPWLSLLRLAFLFGGAAMTLLLVFDARYRGFPAPLYALPLVSLLLLLLAGLKTSRFDVEEAVLAAIILVGTVVFVLMEGLSNRQALMFGLQMILFAGAATGFRYWRFRPRPADPASADYAGA